MTMIISVFTNWYTLPWSILCWFHHTLFLESVTDLTWYSGPHTRSLETGHKLTSQQPEYLWCLTSSGTFAIKDRCLPTKIQIYRDAFPVNSYWVNKYLTFHILTQVVWIARIMDISDTRNSPADKTNEFVSTDQPNYSPSCATISLLLPIPIYDKYVTWVFTLRR